jgi:alcohol dehydrogenase class IV
VRAGAYLGIPGGFAGFRARIVRLRGDLRIPASLSQMGVEAGRLDQLTEMALQDPTAGANPVEMTRENTRSLFQACL